MIHIIRLRTWIAVLSVALAFGAIPACSSTEDIADNSSDSKGQLSISLLGIGEGSEESLTKAQAEAETVTLPVKDDFGLVCTLAADQTSNTRGTTAMTLGNKYRMVAYSGSTVAGSQVFEAGSEDTTSVIPLLHGSYTFVFYSFNNATDPGLPDASGNVAVPAGTDLLWYSTTGTVTAGNVTPVAVTFLRKFNTITVKANSWGVGPTVTVGASSNLDSYAATLNAAAGTLSTSGSATSAAVTWSGTSKELTSTNAPLVYTGGTSIKVTFPASSITIGGTSNTAAKSVTFTKTLVAGTRYTVTVRFTKCGAYTASGVWKAFMCHNLGADYTADPFTPSYKLNGAYWQWGNKDYSVGPPTDAAGTDPSYTWSTSNYNTSSTAWNSGTEASPIKNSTYDPCPSGYRMPTNTEWLGVLSKNTVGIYGTWTGGQGNFSSYNTFGTSTTSYTLYVPTTGHRKLNNGSLLLSDSSSSRGQMGNYWSSTSSGTSSYVTYLYYTTRSSVSQTRYYGYSIRCIAE